MTDLKALRESEKLSRKELARLLGVSPTSIYRFEVGERMVPPAVASKIRDVFNLSTDEMWNTLYRSA